MHMSILDEVQNELREPRMCDYGYRGSETASLADHTYRWRELDNGVLRTEAYKWLSDPKVFRQLREDYECPKLGCVLALGRHVIGYGLGMVGAIRKAEQRGFDPRDCFVAFAPDDCFDAFAPDA